MAKAWRVVRRTTKHNLQFSFETDTEYTTEINNDTYRQPRPTDYDLRHRHMNRRTYQRPSYHNTYKRNTSTDRSHKQHTNTHHNTDQRQKQNYHSKYIHTYKQQPHKPHTCRNSYRHEDQDQDYTDYRPRQYRHTPKYKSELDKRQAHTYPHHDLQYDTEENDEDTEHNQVFYNKQYHHHYANKTIYRKSQTEPDTDSDDAQQTDTDYYNREFPPLPPPQKQT